MARKTVTTKTFEFDDKGRVVKETITVEEKEPGWRTFGDPVRPRDPYQPWFGQPDWYYNPHRVTCITNVKDVTN